MQRACNVGRYLRQRRFQQKPQYDDGPVVQPECDVFEFRPMPQSDGKEGAVLGDDHREEFPHPVPQDSAEAFACLAEELRHGDGIKDVVPAPVAQGDVPSVPEVGQIAREVRPQEVVGHADPHAAGDAPGDIDSSAEISVDLDHIKQQAHKHCASRVLRRIAEDFIHEHRSPVRDDQLLEESPKDKLRAVGQVFVIEPVSFIELTRKLIVPADWSLDDLREE